MRKLFLLLALLSPSVYADIFTARINAGTTNIGTDYQLVTFDTQPNGIISGLVNNRGSSEVAVTCSFSTTTPSNTTSHFVDAASGEAWAIDDAKLGNRCYIRSLSGSTISAGVFVITVTGY